MDIYQRRYLEHQKRKKETLETGFGEEKDTKEKELLLNVTNNMITRRSQRVFNKKPLDESEIKLLELAVNTAPSSCNRQAIYIRYVAPELIEEYLVGGRNWIHNANKVMLIFASKEAYKSPNEKDFMPYLDAGFVGQNVYLMAEALNVGACFVNPNVTNKEEFNDIFNEKGDYFCGAMALGHYDLKSMKPPKRKDDSIHNSI